MHSVAYNLFYYDFKFSLTLHGVLFPDDAPKQAIDRISQSLLNPSELLVDLVPEDLPKEAHVRIFTRELLDAVNYG